MDASRIVGGCYGSVAVAHQFITRQAAFGQKRPVNKFEIPLLLVEWTQLFRLVNPSSLYRPLPNDLNLDGLFAARAVEMDASFRVHNIRSGCQ
jgi:hypothetical protein